MPIPRFKASLPPADIRVMSKRGMLWMVGLVAFGFTYAAAVNITEVNASFGYTTCQGMWNFTNWFGRSCTESLPPRLGVLALGTAALIVCGYFAEKDKAQPLIGVHFTTYWASRAHWACVEPYCNFTTTDSIAAEAHDYDDFDDDEDNYENDQDAAAEELAQGPSTTGNTYGFGKNDAIAKAPPIDSIQATADFKTCPDCAEDVRAAARKCRFCGYMFESQPATQA
jgi:hypothetical protein